MGRPDGGRIAGAGAGAVEKLRQGEHFIVNGAFSDCAAPTRHSKNFLFLIFAARYSRD